MVVKRERRYYSEIKKNDIEDFINVPSCYANYCENHAICKSCVLSSSCKLIQQPKEPQWCNPD